MAISKTPGMYVQMSPTKSVHNQLSRAQPRLTKLPTSLGQDTQILQGFHPGLFHRILGVQKHG